MAMGGYSGLFAYDPSRNLYKRLDTTSGQTTQLITIGGVEFVTKPNGSVDVRRYLPGGIQRTTTYTDGAPGATTQRYLLKDHLGSIDVILASNGSVEQAMSFDAWGLRRTTTVGTNLWSPLNVASLNTFDHSKTTKGYTGHEMVDEVGIIHMGGRIYDPRMGRFLQADPTLQAPTFTQNYNRYSYVVNNPLTLTDPTGYKYTWLDDGGGVKQIVGLAITVYAGWSCAYTCTSWIQAATVGATAGGFNAAMTGGNIAQGAFTGAVLAGVGFNDWGAIGKGAADVGAMAVAGGVTSVLQGGKFGNGFVAAGIGAYAGQNMGDWLSKAGIDNTLGTIAGSAIVGGTASVITGGKFANGAAFGAFAAAVQAGLQSSSEESLQTYKGLREKEIPAEQRKAIIDQAIAEYRAQEGPHLITPIQNAYDEYLLTNERGQFASFDSLKNANSFLVNQSEKYNIQWSYVDGRAWAGGRAIIYAGAAYPRDHSYITSVVPSLYTRFVVWHEAGHVMEMLGGGGCWSNESCADNWAAKHYQNPMTTR